MTPEKFIRLFLARGIMNFLIMHVVSGEAFFSGLFLIIFSLCMSFRKQTGILYKSSLRLFFIIGLVLALISAPSLNPFFKIFVFLFPACALILSSFKRIPDYINIGAKIVSLLICLTAVFLEALTWRMPEIPQEKFQKLYIIGDSVSAGIGFKGEKTWAEIVSERTGLEVVNLSRGGGTVASSINTARAVKDGKSLIFIEIGGNDMLKNIPARDYSVELDKLLVSLKSPERIIVMLELPWAPFHDELRRSQIKTAERYGVILLPRKVFSSVLCGSDSTVDGIHLSNKGQEKMAASFIKICRPLLATKSL